MGERAHRQQDRSSCPDFQKDDVACLDLKAMAHWQHDAIASAGLGSSCIRQSRSFCARRTAPGASAGWNRVGDPSARTVQNYVTIGDRFWVATRARSRLRGQRSLGIPQLRGQIRGDLRLLRRPRLSLAPGARCRLILAAGRSPVPPRDVVGSSWGRFGRTHHHLASPMGAGLFVRELSAGPLGVAGRKAGEPAGAAEKEGITATPDPGTRPVSPLRHRRSWRSPRLLARSGSAKRTVPGSAASAGPGWLEPSAW